MHSVGIRSAAWVLELITRIGEAVTTRPTSSLLADLGGVTGAFTDLDRLTFGQAVASRWIRIPYAVVFHPALVDPRRFGEMVARNRGVNIRVFTEVGEAIAWLDTQAPAFPTPAAR